MPTEIDKTCCMCTSPICRHLACSLDFLKHGAGGGPKPPCYLPAVLIGFFYLSALSIRTWHPPLPCSQRRDFEAESYELRQAVLNSIISLLNFFATLLDAIKDLEMLTPSLSCAGYRKFLYSLFLFLSLFCLYLPASSVAPPPNSALSCDWLTAHC